MEKKLDVSMLEPCEPLERTLEAVQQLSSGDFLHVMHRREPHLLYPLLEKSGFVWHCVEERSDQYAIYIWRESDQVAGKEATSHFSK
jgi:uncharacterized protein (DUF2249 family)